MSLVAQILEITDYHNIFDNAPFLWVQDDRRTAIISHGTY